MKPPVAWTRRHLCGSALGCLLPLHASTAQPQGKPQRQLREMQVFEVPELGLSIWVENQPPWESGLTQTNGRPVFVAESPSNHHPPLAMTYASWPQERVPEGQMLQVATSAVQRASENFGLNRAQARAIAVRPATYGVLSGGEGKFAGNVDGVLMDVLVFVGQAEGRFPVALSIYTIAGKLIHTGEVLRRSWGRLSYL
jgi:hypothetical protein